MAPLQHKPPSMHMRMRMRMHTSILSSLRSQYAYASSRHLKSVKCYTTSPSNNYGQPKKQLYLRASSTVSTSTANDNTPTLTTTAATATTITTTAAATAAMKQRPLKKKKSGDTTLMEPSSKQLFFHAGLPLVVFSLLAAWVLKNSIEGKNREYAASKGQMSKSERQARMEQEHEDMLDKLNTIRKTDFDNTKRIERPEEILERRKRERETRNVWYRRWGRWIIGTQ